VLPTAGVLELVNEQVAYAVGDGHRRVRGKIVVALQHALGNLRDSMKSTVPASAKAICNSPAAWRSSVKQERTICQSSSV